MLKWRKEPRKFIYEYDEAGLNDGQANIRILYERQFGRGSE